MWEHICLLQMVKCSCKNNTFFLYLWMSDLKEYILIVIITILMVCFASTAVTDLSIRATSVFVVLFSYFPVDVPSPVCLSGQI